MSRHPARVAAILAFVVFALPALGQPAPAYVPGAPPAPGTAADIADHAAVAGTWSAARLALADRDRVLDPFAAFSGVLGPGFTPAYLPATTQLLTDVLYAASAAAVAAKWPFHRLRPFVADPALARCPGSDLLEPNRSWPSGHAAIGYAWALLLADLVPARAEAILDRGRDYGVSRVVCGFHWPSDIVEGQAVGAAVAGRIIGDAGTAPLLAAARAELSRITIR
ncbi:MAG: phosphatase PAP2 family protein [Bauldia sp.]|nr:phosphatase PAP2 family protein [Bauldia sp.]